MWDAFRAHLVADDGRVVDADTPRGHTVSEAQAYALFFALVANDPSTFAKLLQWTQNNLASGDLTSRLPAWQWGRRDNGQWDVIDANSASDADLWLIYALAEAGRLWREPRYAALAKSLSNRLLNDSVAHLPGLGPTLLPAPQGFALERARWRLNPSYLAPHLMRWMSHYGGAGWAAVHASSINVLMGSASLKGFSPDWVLYSPDKHFEVDSSGPEQGRGGYNAIRTYLWIGLMHPLDASRKALLQVHRPMAKLTAQLGYVPEYVDIATGLGSAKPGPSSFAAALLPFLQATQEGEALRAQQAYLSAQPVQNRSYYGNALLLFGQGAMNGRYRFALDGRLLTPWATTHNGLAGRCLA